MGKVIWITWERQPRNRSMSAGLRIPLYEILSLRGRALRFASCILRTLVVLAKHRPEAVICQNPSIVLTVLLLWLRPVFRMKVIIDAHFGGVDASSGSNASQGLLDRCNQQADLVIVTNAAHASHVEGLGGRAFVCPDPLPDLSRFRAEANPVIPGKAFLVCSYDSDEPFLEVFKAAEGLARDGYRIFVSGNYRRAGLDPGDYAQVHLLGFVSEEDFYRHMFSSEVVLDLTDNDNCLVCGAYEALEATKPLVLSKTSALQAHFNRGVVFTRNSAADIERAVREAFVRKRELSLDAGHWVNDSKREMAVRLQELNNLVSSLTQRTGSFAD